MKNINIKKLCLGCMKEKPSANCVCPHCGFDVAFYNEPEALPLGCKLQNKYLVGKEIGHGGFGKTYIAYDELLGLLCVKELFPDRAYRDKNGYDIIPRAGFESEFDKLRENAYEEARRLASFRNLPGIVKVYDCFEENNTSYIVMEYVDGINLNEYLDKKGKMSIETVLAKLEPVMKSLLEMHKEGLIHRDIAPDNLMLKDDGTLVLIDFGSARNFTANMSRSLTKTLKSGYAPIEQYSGSNQGPWTDIYELCATIYTLITGNILPDSTERISEDKLSLSFGAVKSLRSVLEKGLAIDYNDRYQTIDELYDALYNAQCVGKRKIPSIFKTKKIIAMLAILLIVCFVMVIQIKYHNLSEPVQKKIAEEALEQNIVDDKAENDIENNQPKEAQNNVDAVDKNKDISKQKKQIEAVASEKSPNINHVDALKTKAKVMESQAIDKTIQKDEPFYKRPVHTSTEKEPYTLGEIRWIYKTEEMLAYMYPKLKTQYAHSKYQELRHIVNSCYNDDGNFRTAGDARNLTQKAQADVESRTLEIHLEAEKILRDWNKME